MTLSPYKRFEKSIRISPDGFSFFRTDNGKLQVEAFENDTGAVLQVEAARFFADEETVNIICATDIPALVPTEIFDPAKTHDYLKIQRDISDSDKTFTFPTDEYTAIFSLPQIRLNTIGNLNKNTNILHETELFLDFLKESCEKDALVVSQNSTFFDMLLMQKGQIQMLNRFNLDAAEDTIYYIMNAVKQFRIKNPSVYIVGHCEKAGKVLEFLKSQKIKTTAL